MTTLEIGDIILGSYTENAPLIGIYLGVDEEREGDYNQIIFWNTGRLSRERQETLLSLKSYTDSIARVSNK